VLRVIRVVAVFDRGLGVLVVGVGPLMLGLFRGGRFAFARATLVPVLGVSILASYVADELLCVERFGRGFHVEVPGLGRLYTDSVCVVDRVLLNGENLGIRSIFHVADMGRYPEYEALIGRDLVYRWRLVVDRTTGRVRSLASLYQNQLHQL